MRSRCVGTFVRIITFLAAALPAAAQLSNSSLNGAYNFRYLGVTVAPCDCPVSFIGTVTFDGNGGFKISGQGNYVNSSGTTQTLTPAASGTYTVFSSGMFYMDNPFAAAGSNTLLYGGIGQSGAGQSAVVASSTESENLDTFFAMPAATSASNATLSGTYQVGSLEFAGGTIGGSRQTFFNMASDGKGGLGTVTINGTSLALNNAATTQTSAGATYSVTANGSGTMTFPAPSGVSAANQLLSGAKNLYVSTDGNWFVAGTPTGYDVVVGIKAMPAGSPNPPLKGIYFFSELENYAIGGSAAGVYAYQGSTNELGDSAGTELAHLRVDSDLSYPYDQTSSYTYTFNSSGVATYTGLNLAAGGNGSLYLVAGGAGDYYVSLGIQVQAINGSAVFLSPYGVVNAATNAPFTAQLSPGEVITLYGSGLAPAGTNASSSAPFPNTLAGVGVTINNTPAPVYSVTPTQINAVVPYSLDPSVTSNYIANVQVSNNGAPSNTVTEYIGLTSPGVFTVPAGGIGLGAVLHADYTLVTNASPAKAGDTILIFLTGLGSVKPAVNAGAPAPSNPLSNVVNQVSVYLTDPTGNSVTPTVAFQGLAPNLGGLYQLNVTLPSGIGTGLNTLEVDGVDAVTIQATVPIGK